jgi:hypothetical protein
MQLEGKTTERQLGHAISTPAIDRFLHPVAIGRVVCRIFTVGIYHYSATALISASSE